MGSDVQNFHLPDMSCGHCVAAITEAIHELDAAARLNFDREGRHLQVEGSSKSRTELAAALTEAGYPPSHA
ncbi:heavy-metal-associated domain-containing protein [Pelomonas sp. SE-A7]|uniref:heavy-metal-associated domain-containing protein n=1 Tax=Pelomonas sp. SE-A7 TaxID=3054953 RepID=UPI00259CF3AF|nr:heavy-metal-associated domain-containing protein [Pelomonas sp. SE-A7]MDM4767870.1 heavy-metal-associated domain-containing protein [Pelomonas sp. SE-A7]